MKRKFEKRIKTYIVISILMLIVVNSLSIMYLLSVVDSYIEKNGEYASIELKDTYKKAYELETYYLSSSSEYNRYFLEEWYIIIENFYCQVKNRPQLKQQLFSYLDEIGHQSSMSIKIYDSSLNHTVYPSSDGSSDLKKGLRISPEILEDLEDGGNVLFESQEEAIILTTKIMKMSTGEYLVMTLKGDYAYDEFIMDSALNHIKFAFDKNDRYLAYYVINSKNEVLFTSEEQGSNIVLDIKNKKKSNLMDYDGSDFRIIYRDTFYVNQKMYSDAAFYLLPLEDGNRLIVLIDESLHDPTIHKIIFIALLMTFAGVVVLYFMGTAMIFLVDKHNLTAQHVTNSNQVNRMIMVIFVVLILLNGMSAVQINKVIFTKGYEKIVLDCLINYAEMVKERENQFKHFVKKTRNNILVQTTFIYKGMNLIEEDVYKSRCALKEVESLKKLKTVNKEIEKIIKEKGYYEYYQGPKLFKINDFEAFYESYVLEQLDKKVLNALYSVTLYPSMEGDDYGILKRNISSQMDMLYELRKEFKDLCQPDENELFISNVSVYNDTGIAVISNAYNKKFASKKLRDELTGYPLWYWYQFKHEELFRTVIKSIDGTYKENYSLVYYQDDFEYYFVYSVPKKIIFKDIEQLYNVYVSAMMFLLVSVFLTLGVRIKVR